MSSRPTRPPEAAASARARAGGQGAPTEGVDAVVETLDLFSGLGVEERQGLLVQLRNGVSARGNGGRGEEGGARRRGRRRTGRRTRRPTLASCLLSAAAADVKVCGDWPCEEV